MPQQRRNFGAKGSGPDVATAPPYEWKAAPSAHGGTGGRSGTQRGVVGVVQRVVVGRVGVEIVLRVVLVHVGFVHGHAGVGLADLFGIHVDLVDRFVLDVVIAQVGVQIGQDQAVAGAVARRLQDFGALALVIAFLVIAVVARPVALHLMSTHRISPGLPGSNGGDAGRVPSGGTEQAEALGDRDDQQ
ncbi:hypothetical protein WR25_19415 [Diploscapter pachys]|uniref:Uncharacterized protein n=1 Tax=Diploscapter pachys TaxID=2018661 RepID=A0A2A2M1Q0_9BILA|nr:hypothetical protein WR25_19415 [Diploscapter pachys]